MNLQLRFIFIFVFSFIFLHTAYAQSSWNWAKSMGGERSDSIETTSMYNSNMLIGGIFYSDTIHFDGFALQNADVNGVSSDAFVTEYDDNGKVKWSTKIGGSGMEHITAIRVSSFYNIIVAGTFTTEDLVVDTFHLKTQPGITKSFLIAYDTATPKKVIWAKTFDNINITSIALDDLTGDFAVTGNFSSPTITIDTTTLTNKGKTDIFVLLLDKKGNLKKATSFGQEGDDRANSIFNYPGNSAFYICGSSTSLPFGNKGGKDILIVSLDAATLKFKSLRNIGGTADEEAVSIKQNHENNYIYFTGTFSSPSLTFDSKTLKNNGSGKNLFIAKMTSSFGTVWAKGNGGTGGNGDMNVKGFGVPYNTNTICIGGDFTTPSVSFDSTTLSNTGPSNLFISEYNLNGDLLKAFTASSLKSHSTAIGAYVGDDQQLYVAGNYRSADIAFDPFQYNNSGNTATSDIFIAKLNSAMSISKQNNSIHFSIYPNPTTGKVALDINKTDIEKINVLSPLGQFILSLQPTNEIDLSSENPGIYIIQIVTKEKEVLHKKLMLIKY